LRKKLNLINVILIIDNYLISPNNYYKPNKTNNFNKKNKKFSILKFLILKYFNNNFLFFFYLNTPNYLTVIFNFSNLNIFKNISILKTKILFNYNQFFADGFIFLRGLFIIFFIDACVTDDEPLWEPLEWSLVQTWIFFIFFFSWIAENLITSRFGSYTGRDKKIWNAWYRTFWLIEFWFLFSYFSAILFIIIPFYYEITYLTSFIFSWWNWYSKIFFFKFISLYVIILFLANYLLINLKFFNIKKLLILVLLIVLFLSYNLYFQFLLLFFGYFSDPIWYQNTRHIDFIQLSHEPLKWGWGIAKRDHFTYHNVATIFWFKNDVPFIGAMFLIHFFYFISWFFIYLFWLILLRKIYTTKEISFTFTTYCVSALKQNFYFFLLIYSFIIFSFIINYWRIPVEFFWFLNFNNWFYNFFLILKDYIFFLINIII